MSNMKTINIKGKEYVTVNERLKAFRSQFKDYSLIGTIVEQTPDSVTFEARVIDDKGIVRANAFSRETVGKGGVNKFAMLENAETSAWGRALGNFGIGIDTAVCTADELNAKLQYEEDVNQPEQKEPEKTKKKTSQAQSQPQPSNYIEKFDKTIKKLEGVPDGSIDMGSADAEKQIKFISDLLGELKAAGFDNNAKELEKLFNQKLKNPMKK